MPMKLATIVWYAGPMCFIRKGALHEHLLQHKDQGDVASNIFCNDENLMQHENDRTEEVLLDLTIYSSRK